LQKYDSVTVKYPTCAVPFGEEIFFIDKQNDGKVKAWNRRRNTFETLFCFNKSVNPMLSVNDRYIVLTLPNEDSLTIYDRYTFRVKNNFLSFKPARCLLHSNDQLLVVLEVKDGMKNYKVNDLSDLIELWSYNYTGVCNVCTDNGYIFVGSSNLLGAQRKKLFMCCLLLVRHYLHLIAYILCVCKLVS